MESVSIGDFVEMVMFRVPVRVPSTKGQMIESFSDYRKGLVKVDRYGDAEMVQGERVNLPGTIGLTGHYDGGLTTKHRVLLDGVDYNILSIEPMHRRRFMKVVAVKVFE